VQQHWTPPPRIDPKQLKPPRLWYWLSAIPAIVGTLLAIYFTVAFVDALDPDLDHFRTNQSTDVRLNSGDRTIYVQTFGTSGATGTSSTDLSCSVRHEGQQIDVQTTGAETLDVNADSYVGRFKFKVPEDGSYAVLCEGPRNVPLAIGPHLLSFGLYAPLVWGTIAFIVGIALTIAIAVIVAVKRSGHKKRLQREAQASAAR